MNWEKVFVEPKDRVKRIGYKGFLSIIWVLWKMNKQCRKKNFKAKYEFILPVKWFK